MRTLRQATAAYVLRARRRHGDGAGPYSRGVMSVVDSMSTALHSAETGQELRRALVWVFVDGLARSEARSGSWWAGAAAVIGDLELALHGWGDEHVIDVWSALAFQSAAEALSGAEGRVALRD
ncbi:hypothetical protein [Cellulosimicrobium cellulans]|uniref:hypothetical protein n=1 Tax=Cellulosimicrobium cellulans TaxID=1710 RepID=UPI002406A857|nr:hypothetical protein [Cellulosimicrobium cellulans]MDF9875472.1 hypothetical protein [Cellulosimicrobium cellulans]